MNDVWKRIKSWIESYEAIEILENNNIVSVGGGKELRITLLDEIIETCRQEVDE